MEYHKTYVIRRYSFSGSIIGELSVNNHERVC
jgi:hypothetical protein